MSEGNFIFGNELGKRDMKKAVRNKTRLMKRFGDGSNLDFSYGVMKNESLFDYLGIKELFIQEAHQSDLEKSIEFDPKSLIVGNIRMGYGHYRISMAIASCANHLGYTPYWMDLNSFRETTGGRIINHLNGLYSLGSRLSDKYAIFNRFYWEPLNSEGFKKLAYNMTDQEMTRLMAPLYKAIPKSLPYVATHVWPSQAALHGGMTNVVNVIPDNWPMALHLSEGAIHTVQTPSSYFGYRTLKGMNRKNICKPMDKKDIAYVGHYVDHELVEHIDEDCQRRIDRRKKDQPLRFLLTVGGAGAQKDMIAGIINHLLPLIEAKKAVLLINIGDHSKVWEEMKASIPKLSRAKLHFNDWDETARFAESGIDGDLQGIHVFYHDNIFQAVYSTNLLMRASDVLVTKPSELSFYPIPKLLIKRVGGHEAYGALRASEIGDGTLECENLGLAKQMIDLMVQDNDICIEMCHNIKKAHSIGIYNGGYEAVRLAINGRQELESE